MISSSAARTSLLIAAAYGLTSMSTSFVFKFIMSSWKFEAHFTLISLQMAFVLIVCQVLRSRQERGNAPIAGAEVPAFDQNALRDALLPGSLFVVNIAAGLVGLQLVNMPMFLAVRRTGAAFAMLSEYLILHKAPGGSVGMAVSVIVLGALVAGWDTLGRDALGFLFTLANNALTAAGAGFSKKFSDAHSLRGFGLPYYNALIALPLCMALAVLNGEVKFIMGFKNLLNPAFLAALLTVSVLGVWTNYIVFLCSTHNGPLVTSITGTVKDVLATVLGIIIPLGGTQFIPSASAVAGLILSFIGASLFCYAKWLEGQRGKMSPSQSRRPSARVGAQAEELVELKTPGESAA